jgi:hypothetical protein
MLFKGRWHVAESRRCTEVVQTKKNSVGKSIGQSSVHGWSCLLTVMVVIT